MKCSDWLPRVSGEDAITPTPDRLGDTMAGGPGVLPVSPEEDHQNLPSERKRTGGTEEPLPTPGQTVLSKHHPAQQPPPRCSWATGLMGWGGGGVSHLQEGRSGRVQFGVALNLGTRSQLQQCPCSTCFSRFCTQSREGREEGRRGRKGGEGGRYRPKGFPSQAFALETCWSEGPEIPLTTASGAGMDQGWNQKARVTIAGQIRGSGQC